MQTEGTLLTSVGSHKGIFHCDRRTDCWSRVATESTQKHFQPFPCRERDFSFRKPTWYYSFDKRKFVKNLKFCGSIIQGYLKIRIGSMLNLLIIGKLWVQIWKIVKWNVVRSKSHKIRINFTAVRGEYTRTWYCKKNLIMRFRYSQQQEVGRDAV